MKTVEKLLQQRKQTPELVLARWIMNHPVGKEGRDWACKMCCPTGLYLIDGFLCGYHLAEYIAERGER